MRDAKSTVCMIVCLIEKRPGLSPVQNPSAVHNLCLAVGNAIDRAVIVVRHQQGPILQDFHVRRATNVAVVLNEAGEERLRGFHRAILVEENSDDVATKLLRPVPGTMAGEEDSVLVFRREHLASVEAQAETGRMWAR